MSFHTIVVHGCKRVSGVSFLIVLVQLQHPQAWLPSLFLQWQMEYFPDKPPLNNQQHQIKNLTKLKLSLFNRASLRLFLIKKIFWGHSAKNRYSTSSLFVTRSVAGHSAHLKPPKFLYF